MTNGQPGIESSLMPHYTRTPFLIPGIYYSSYSLIFILITIAKNGRVDHAKSAKSFSLKRQKWV